MSDLSRLLGDVYHSEGKPDGELSGPLSTDDEWTVDELEPAGGFDVTWSASDGTTPEAAAPAWADDATLDEAFADWVPGSETGEADTFAASGTDTFGTDALEADAFEFDGETSYFDADPAPAWTNDDGGEVEHVEASYFDADPSPAWTDEPDGAGTGTLDRTALHTWGMLDDAPTTEVEVAVPDEASWHRTDDDLLPPSSRFRLGRRGARRR